MSTCPSTYTLPTLDYCENNDQDNQSMTLHSCREGVEYKGVMFISDKNASLPLTVKELWFCARSGNENNENNKNGKEKSDMPILRGQEASKASMHLAKMMHTKEKLGCTYDKNIEELLKKAIPDMYAI